MVLVTWGFSGYDCIILIVVLGLTKLGYCTYSSLPFLDSFLLASTQVLLFFFFFFSHLKIKRLHWLFQLFLIWNYDSRSLAGKKKEKNLLLHLGIIDVTQFNVTAEEIYTNLVSAVVLE